MFSAGVELYEPGRYARQQPTVRQWLRVMNVCNVGRHGFNLCRFKEEDATALPDEIAVDERAIAIAEIGIRIKAGRAWVNDNMTPFY